MKYVLSVFSYLLKTSCYCADILGNFKIARTTTEKSMLTLIDTLIRAAYAQPGWGPSPWRYNQTVNLQCDKCKSNRAVAYFTRWPPLPFYFNQENKVLEHGAIAFCPSYFGLIATVDAVVKKAIANEKSEQLNVLTMESQGTISSPVIYLLAVSLTDDFSQQWQCFTNDFIWT